MKTITTQEIDGLNIITGIGDVNGLIDPEATKKVVRVEITKTDVHKNIQKIKKQMSLYAKQAHEAMKHAKKAGTDADKDRFVVEYKARKLQFEEEQEKMKPLAAEMSAKYKSMMIEHAEYFSPKPGEEILPDEEVDAISAQMTAATQAGKLLSRDGEEIDNYVGRTFWKLINGRWERLEIHALGVAPVSGSYEIKDLDVDQVAEISEQLEVDRILGLSPANKTIEKESILSGLLTRSAVMKNELEILADKDALTKAQAWLADETAIVNLKYA